ncbi:MAG: metallophosphoesterase [Pseudomonadota bacterium]
MTQLLRLLLLTGGSLCSACVLSSEQYRWDDVPRLIAFSDVHGAYDQLQELLSDLELIDGDNRWIGGETHLVSTGDLLDRGADSRKVMDLLIDLQDQAEASGGRVHVVLGNHELMNLYGDLRYVIDGEYLAYAGDQDDELRQRFQEQLSEQGLSIEALGQKFPPGFFAHRELFRPDGKYGRWINGLPFLIVVNQTAFAHGGVSPAVIGKDLGEVNRILHTELNQYLTSWLPLRDAGVVTPGDGFWDRYEKVQAWLGTQPADAELTQAATRFLDTEDSWLLGSDNPQWYRGNINCGPIFKGPATQDALQSIGANRLVVGHTPTPGRVQSHLGQRVIALDTGMAPYYKGRASALIFNGDELTVFYADDDSFSSPQSVPRSIGPRPGGLSDDQLQSLLTQGDVVEDNVEELNGREVNVLHISDGTHRVRALFQPGKNLNEVAAYRLDRVLGLDLIPVTVPRTHKGKKGWLRFWVEGAVSEQQRQSQSLRFSPNCSLKEQYDLMNTFDTLIFNEGRTLDSILYERNSWDLVLVDHDRAFKTKSGRPPHLKNADLFLNKVLVQRLTDLTAENLNTHLDGLLGKSQVKGLLKRRDQILKRK